MSDRLRQLLDPKPLVKRSQVSYGTWLELCRRRRDEVALVRETMMECAKVMCLDCRTDGVLLLQGNEEPNDFYHDTNDKHPCPSWPIHALLAEKGTTDNG